MLDVERRMLKPKPLPGSDVYGSHGAVSRMPQIRTAKASPSGAGAPPARASKDGGASAKTAGAGLQVDDGMEEERIRSLYAKQAMLMMEEMRETFTRDLLQMRGQMQEAIADVSVALQPGQAAGMQLADVQIHLTNLQRQVQELQAGFRRARPGPGPTIQADDRSSPGVEKAAATANLSERVGKQQKELRALAELVRTEFTTAKKATLTPMWKERIIQELAQGELRAVCADEVGKGFRELTASFHEREVRAALLRLEAGGAAPWEPALNTAVAQLHEDFRRDLSQQNQRFTELLRQSETEQRSSLRDGIGGLTTRIGVVESRLTALTGRCGDLERNFASHSADYSERMQQQAQRFDKIQSDLMTKCSEQTCRQIEETTNETLMRVREIADTATLEARSATRESRLAQEQVRSLMLEIGSSHGSGAATPVQTDRELEEGEEGIAEGVDAPTAVISVQTPINIHLAPLTAGSPTAAGADTTPDVAMGARLSSGATARSGSKQPQVSGLRESIRQVREDVIGLQKDIDQLSGKMALQAERTDSELSKRGTLAEETRRLYESRLSELEEKLNMSSKATEQVVAKVVDSKASAQEVAVRLDNFEKQLQDLNVRSNNTSYDQEDMRKLHESSTRLNSDANASLRQTLAEQEAEVKALTAAVQQLAQGNSDVKLPATMLAAADASSDMDAHIDIEDLDPDYMWDFGHRWMDMVDLESNSDIDISRASPDSEDHLHWNDMLALDPSLADTAATFSRGTPVSGDGAFDLLLQGMASGAAGRPSNAFAKNGKGSDYPQQPSLQGRHGPGSEDVDVDLASVPHAGSDTQALPAPDAWLTSLMASPIRSSSRLPPQADSSQRESPSAEEQYDTVSALPDSLRATLVASPVEAESLFSMPLRTTSHADDGGAVPATGTRRQSEAQSMESTQELVAVPHGANSTISGAPKEIMPSRRAAAPAASAASGMRSETARTLVSVQISETSFAVPSEAVGQRGQRTAWASTENATASSAAPSLAAHPLQATSVVDDLPLDPLHPPGRAAAASAASDGRQSAYLRRIESQLADVSAKIVDVAEKAERVSDLKGSVEHLLDTVNAMRASAQKGEEDLKETVSEQKGQLAKLDACVQKLMEFILRAEDSDSASSSAVASLDASWQSCAAAILDFHLRCDDFSDGASSVLVSRATPDSDESGVHFLQAVPPWSARSTPPLVDVLEEALSVAPGRPSKEGDAQSTSTLAQSVVVPPVPQASGSPPPNVTARRRTWSKPHRSNTADASVMHPAGPASKATSMELSASADDESTQPGGLGQLSSWLGLDHSGSTSVASLSRGTPASLASDVAPTSHQDTTETKQ
mmetsp:Transcript_10151/g.22859  ORF Transcript_10151/g.22859 Transcript_10151/m.22859 type:complete len:1338 (-) Transcript_10151:124-4137(-)